MDGNDGLEPVEKLRAFAKSPPACKDGHRRGREQGATAINPELFYRAVDLKYHFKKKQFLQERENPRILK